MNERSVLVRGVYLLVLAVISVVVWSSYPNGTTSLEYLQVHFLDVGQGDAVLIETPDGTEVLIDGGRSSAVLRALGEKRSISDHALDMVVATHPDSDHIGGLIDVLERYDVNTILMTENHSDTSVAAEYARLIHQEGAEIVYARAGQTFSLGASTTLEVLFPDTDPTNMESNTSSIVLRLSYGDSDFLFTGDSPKQIEEYLVLKEGEHLESEVLKVGHHGSRTSTAELFLDEVNPQYAVISAGKDNQYGHPHVEVTDTLFNHRVETYSTAEDGTITFLSDGVAVWME